MAAQDDPNRNHHFRRCWGDAGATGPSPAPMRAWHADAPPPPRISAARAKAERQWRKVATEVAPC